MEVKMFDCITFDEYGRMFLIFDGVGSRREEIQLGDNLCAVFTFQEDFDLDRLPDAEHIRKCIPIPYVHVFVGIEKKEPQKEFALSTHGPLGTHFAPRVFGKKIAQFMWKNIHSLLGDVT